MYQEWGHKIVIEVQNFILSLIANPFFWLGFLGFICLVWAWKKLTYKTKPLTLIGTEFGYISTTYGALESLVKSTCKEEGVSSNVRVIVTKKRNKLNLKLKTKLPVTKNIEEWMGRLQKSVHNTLEKQLGSNQIYAIDILVAGFEQERKLESKTEEPATK